MLTIKKIKIIKSREKVEIIIPLVVKINLRNLLKNFLTKLILAIIILLIFKKLQGVIIKNFII